MRLFFFNYDHFITNDRQNADICQPASQFVHMLRTIKLFLVPLIHIKTYATKKRFALQNGSIEHRKDVFSGIRFDVYQWNQKQFDGSEHVYETVRRADNVCVLPIIGDEMIIVKEEQPHWGRQELILLPACLKRMKMFSSGQKGARRRNWVDL